MVRSTHRSSLFGTDTERVGKKKPAAFQIIRKLEAVQYVELYNVAINLFKVRSVCSNQLTKLTTYIHF